MAELVLPSRDGGHAAIEKALLLANSDELPYRVMRCLVDAGMQVHVLGARESSVRRLAKSAHCRSIDLVPFDDIVSGAATGSIDTLAARLGIGLVVPSDPETTRFLAWHGDRLRTPHFPVLAGPIFERLVNKEDFSGVCQELGLPHPHTEVFGDPADAVAYVDQHNSSAFFVKPTDGVASIGVWKYEPSSPDARRRLQDVAYRPILVQDFVAGTDVNVLLLCNRGSVVTSIAYETQATQYNVVADPAVLKLLKLAAAGLGLNGPIGFDMRRDHEGRYFFIECNPRFTFDGSMVSLLAGINIIRAALRPGSVPQAAPAMRMHRSKLLRPWTLATRDRRHAAYLLSDAKYNASMAINQFVRAKVNRGWA